jgi:hypothetical protein
LGEITPVSVKFEFCVGMVKESTAVHPFDAVTVTVYTPAERLRISSVVNPFDHEKVFPLAGSIERSTTPF